MGVYKRGKTWWYHFTYAGRNVQESAKTKTKAVAVEAERNRRRELEDGFNGIDTQGKKDRVRTVANASAVYLKEYKLKHSVVRFADYAIQHLCEHLGAVMLAAIDDGVVSDYQLARLAQKASPTTINQEVGVLLRIMGERGDLLRSRLRRKRKLNLAVTEQPGKAFNVEEKDAMMRASEGSRSPLILPALTLALNAGMRDSEIKRTQWSQIDFAKAILTVGKSKTAAGQGRTIPLNSEILPALLEHAKWYTKKFGELNPDWYVFPFGRSGHMDPTRHVTTLKTAWTTVRKRAEVKGRWHDKRHTLITELAESGAGDETIMAIAGHVSRQMLTRYSHIRTEAKRNALEDVLARRQKVRAVNQEAADKVAKEAAATTVN